MKGSQSEEDTLFVYSVAQYWCVTLTLVCIQSVEDVCLPNSFYNFFSKSFQRSSCVYCVIYPDYCKLYQMFSPVSQHSWSIWNEKG